MGPVSWVAVGVLAGLLARWIVPQSALDGFIVTVPLGISGASVGGFVVGVPGGAGATGFNVWSVLAASLGAVTLLLVYGLVARRVAEDGSTIASLSGNNERSSMVLRTADHRRTKHDLFGEPRSYAGYEVRDPLGKTIGTAEEIFADLNDEPRYVRVKMGLFGLRAALIPVQLVAADTRRRVLMLR